MVYVYLFLLFLIDIFIYLLDCNALILLIINNIVLFFVLTDVDYLDTNNE